MKPCTTEERFVQWESSDYLKIFSKPNTLLVTNYCIWNSLGDGLGLIEICLETWVSVTSMQTEFHFQRHLEYFRSPQTLFQEWRAGQTPSFFNLPSSMLKSLIALKETWTLRNFTDNFIKEIQVTKPEPAANRTLTAKWFASEAKNSSPLTEHHEQITQVTCL